MATIQEIKDSYSKYIVSPINQFGIGGFVFDIEKDTTSILSANITDHFVEENFAVQDHIALSPERIVLNSDVGELVFIDENEVETFVQKAAQRLVALGAFLPDLADAEQQIKDLAQTNVADIDEQTLDSITDLWQLTRNLNPGANRQQQAYLYFKALFEQRAIVSVQTPFSFLQSMAIENITATQPEGSAFISSFSISLKQIRTTSFAAVPFDASKFQGRGAQQREPESQISNSNGEKELTSALYRGLESIGVAQR